MKIFYDTEFFDDGEQLHLISIGMVAEDGRELYLINEQLPWYCFDMNDFLRDEVAPYLPIRECRSVAGTGTIWVWDEDHEDFDKVVTPVAIRARVEDFIEDTPEAELWGYYSAYDHVLLAQLWGRMIDRPPCVPQRTNDLQQEIERYPDFVAPDQEQPHHALDDARWNKRVWERLEEHETARQLDRDPGFEEWLENSLS